MGRHREHPPDHHDGLGRHLPPENFPPGKEAPGDLESLRRFVNTVNHESGADRLGDPAQLAAWLAREGVEAGAVTTDHWQAAIDLREALRLLAEANHGPGSDPGQAVVAFNVVAARSPSVVRWDEAGGTRLEPLAGGVDRYLAWLTGVVHAAVGDGTWWRLKACRNVGCRWAFYDHTKNRSGSWCAMKACGDRLKARAYRGRLATAQS